MKKINIRIPIIIVLTIILSIMCYFYFKDDNKNDFKNFDFSSLRQNRSSNSNTTTLTSTAQITSALTEKIELHATYYFSKVLVEENQFVKKGTKLVKYTNGNYLVAPYDCVIVSLNIPKEDGQCTNSHYIEISSNNVLQVKLSVDESKISSIEIGKSAKVKISAIEEEIEGIVTKISNTASKGKFTVTVEFNNNSNVMIGMTASVTI